MFQNGDVFEGEVKSSNRGGVLVDCWGVPGFIPNSMVQASGKPDVGQPVRAMFVEVDELKNRLILSQRQAAQAELIKTLSIGQQVQGCVSWIEGYGVFVDIALPDGGTVSGLIHKSELSWSRVTTPDSVVTIGEWVKCAVTELDPAKCRVGLSLKQLKPDPLKGNIASMTNAAELEWREPTVAINRLNELVRELQFENGITEVKLGRQADAKGAVSQDLEIWLTKAVVDGHFNVMARAGGTIQEVEVYCTLDQASLKQTIDSVLTRF